MAQPAMRAIVQHHSDSGIHTFAHPCLHDLLPFLNLEQTYNVPRCFPPAIALWGVTAPWHIRTLRALHQHLTPQSDNVICMPSLNIEHLHHAWQEIRR